MEKIGNIEMAEWIATTADVIRDKVQDGEGVYGILTPPDYTGRYDVACRDHTDATDDLRETLADMGIPASCTRVYANGYYCGTEVRVAPQGHVDCLMQHSGNWGPWYHVSRYQRTPKGGWKFVAKIGGHYNYREARKLGLPVGLPKI